MKVEDPRRMTGGDKTIPTLIVAASCVILFTLAWGVVLHKSTQRLLEARDWVNHTGQVQASLSSIQLRLDRLDAVRHLYLLNKLWTTLREGQNLSVLVESNVEHVAALVADNRGEDANVGRLRSCTHQVALDFRSLAASGNPLPTASQFACREVLIAMQEQEATLLNRREKESQDSRIALALATLSLIVFYVVGVVVVFWVWVKDASVRRRAEERLSESNQQLAASIQVLEERATEMRLIGFARDELQMCLTTQDAYEATVNVVSRLLPASSGALFMIDNSRRAMEALSSWGDFVNTSESFVVDSCCAMRSGRIRQRSPESSEVHCTHFAAAPPERYVCVPLVAHGETMGVLYVVCAGVEAAELVEQRLDHLSALLQLASMTIAGINLRRKLENQSIRDSLTGLFNRHFMEISLEREVRRAARRNSSMAVFMIDADNFKGYNDTFGHSAGDLVLRAIAERFLGSVRSEDIVCRYGGEEFVIILPDIVAAKATERAEHIREAVASLRVSEHGQTLGPVTVSIGVAMYPQDGSTIEDLLRGSDRSLYAAKNSGRNKVIFANQAPFPIPAR